MVSRWTDTLGGVNAYVQALAKAKDTKDILITVIVFDSQEPSLVLRRNIPAHDWVDISDTEVFPRAGTPLYDAIGHLVSTAMADKPEKSAIIITTDGQENSSKEHTKETAKNLLDKCREKGWQVLFLGVDFDNMGQGTDLGNAAASTITLTAQNAQQVFVSTAHMRGVYASGVAQSMSYSDKDRKVAVAPKNSFTSPRPTAIL
jgi:Mg-chelatase subunit ChlD